MTMDGDEDIRVVVPKDLMTKTVGSRGRISVGTEYAGKDVTVAVLDVQDN